MGESGKLQLGKFLIAEKVFTSDPTMVKADDPAVNQDLVAFEFFLTGPLAVERSSSYESFFADGGEFQVDLGISTDGTVWSDERSFRFLYYKGAISPAP